LLESCIENKSINELHPLEVNKIIEAIDFTEAEKNVYKIPRKQKDNKFTSHFRNFKFFYGRLAEKSDSQLNLFARVFLEKCQIIEIRSWEIEQAITMFNSLNSTGMPLSDADIISAKLYSNAGHEKELFNESWKNINNLSDELNIRRIVSLDSILQQFMYINRAKTKEYINNESVDVTTPGLRRYYTELQKNLLNEPFELCSNFIKIAHIWDTIKDFPIIKLLLKFNENVKLFLIGYLYRYEPVNIKEENVLEISECLLRLFTIMELVDSGYSSKNFKTFLFGINIKLVDIKFSDDEIKKVFNEHINNNWSQENISEAISEYDKNILVFLNEYLFTKNKSIKFDFSENVNIEHIMPASGHNIEIIRQDAGIFDKDEFYCVVNKLGNKILLEEDINKSLGNEWFNTKKQNSIYSKTGYKDSKYSIALELTNYFKNTWNKDDINKATNKAATRIVNFIFNK